jgi:hypothetical protein
LLGLLSLSLGSSRYDSEYRIIGIAYYDRRVEEPRTELLIAETRIPEFKDWLGLDIKEHAVPLDRHGMHEVALGGTVHWV